MINSNTSFGKLREVIVGRELNLDRRIVDVTFKTFYKEAIGQTLYESPFDEYQIQHKFISERIFDLDNLAQVLTNLGITVYRPDEISSVIKIKTPTFQTEASSASNVRDLTLVYHDMIIETPTYVRNRYFENRALYSIYSKCFDNGKGGKWVKAPNTALTETSIDLDDWKKPRNYTHIDSRFEMGIDGAQFLRIGRDVIVNVTTYNHYLGYKWVESFFPDSTFHMISIADNHIDGAIICLKPGVFLVDPKYKNLKDILPSKFKSWKFIYPENLPSNIDTKGMTNIDIRLASSRGMDINVLSIDENTVIVNDRAIGVIHSLEKNGFTVIPVQLRHGEIFAGGIHCSTLDINRDDQYIYF